MKAQIFLIAPKNGSIDELCDFLEQAHKDMKISAVLLLRDSSEDKIYEKRVRATLPITQKHQSALLLDDCPKLAKRLGADGVHINSDIHAIKDAIKLLKPEMIVGAGDIFSKDDAMIKGESGVDYVFFGEIGKIATQQTHELAAWWASSFEVPAVYFDEKNTLSDYTSENCEFVALSRNGFVNE